MLLHWHRRDLRTRDNRSLARAASTDEPVVSLFVFDPGVLEHASPIRVACLLEALDGLRSWYRDHGSDLLVARGDPSDSLPRIAAEYDVDTVTWNENYSGLARERDRAVTAALEDASVSPETTHDAILHEPGSITPNQGEHYSVFSYFWKKWRDREKETPFEAPGGDDLAAVTGDALPSLSDLGFDEPEATPPTVTQQAARERVASFCSGPIYRYDERRDYPAAGATSRLSVHYKWGTIGPREVYAATERAAERAETDDDRDGVTAFQRQLAFREFYAHVLSFNPEIVTENFSGYDHEIEWRNDPDEFDAWKNGETGYPIVDAGMRQLRAEGWVHNRVRMIVAAFLTKDLLIDWRKGYDWYRRQLADHDTANDVGGWQWAASTGMDAQPYFRVFNPTKQCREYDPDGEYVRRYVPELEDASTDEIHDWPTLTDEQRAAAAADYPAPIVDHGRRRELAIETFERARGDEN
ncbi:cryptochrome/photolyase family protein [Natronobacterium gregoryi]|uniref:Deoxyribodipyrimidine photo-lyase n=2 Tax=Natronobacterium gregoryi TaxID=44930 RepID=L0AE02_NATGS|nr:deoxyribodipyrimidine photo-lyase [Natronobacterium gregoryi]AFZ71285.1 deoxyribodipyrimidine photolyase [Natronobacterium gregoryi SP2]ELY67217.1 deoxyribodipyrimidine photolyase [Natronobacterium gregoryi SP2]PLK19868.1 deoxyribodipyrimidine photo-lyase [Natronobacterium gregoryi SP2]SFJ39488.1 deoxyribodipyrimidine photo-lyase type I [Natronobacterium gregoryi]